MKLLLFSANRWEKDKDIRSFLTEGKNVILDRYLDLDINIAKYRSVRFGDEIYENKSTLKAVQDIYHHLMEEFWITINASHPFENVHNKIMQIVLELINSNKVV